MDIRYDTALRHAAKAWANQLPIDTAALQDLKHRHAQPPRLQATPKKDTSKPMHEQPLALATSGTLGTRLNIFA